MEPAHTEKLISLFRKNGFKVTTQRLAICKLIFSRKDHPSTEEIYNLLKNEHPTISLATVYKTLHLLKELKVIQELNFDEGKIRYDPDMDLHVNLVCSNCGKINDYKSQKINELWKQVTSDLDITPEGQRIDIYHECDDCKAKNQK